MTVVLDYGVNNLRSVERAVQHIGFPCTVQNSLAGATKLILPGVGAFQTAMKQLEPVKNDLRQFAASGKPILGICLGMQLLFQTSEEFEVTEGLGIVPGAVRYIPPQPGLKVPHVGWGSLEPASGRASMSGVRPGDRCYFVHSLVCEPKDVADISATCRHGILFAAAIERGNVWGTQFHPEKSGSVGLQILENFLKC